MSRQTGLGLSSARGSGVIGCRLTSGDDDVFAIREYSRTFEKAKVKVTDKPAPSFLAIPA